MERLTFDTIRVRFQRSTCFVRLDRPERNNAINAQMVEDLHRALDLCEESATVLVLEGAPEVFSTGADFVEISKARVTHPAAIHDPEPLFRLWQRLTDGPFISVAHVRGRANAGGLGFVAASDVVLADITAEFSLSELLFNLLPSCVLPFLARRVGFQRARYLALSTRPIAVQEAYTWGLVDAYEQHSDVLLRTFLSRLNRVPRSAIASCKDYLRELDGGTEWTKPRALAVNRDVFSDPRYVAGITRYVEDGLFPWED